MTRRNDNVSTKEIAEAIELLEGAKAEELVKKALNEGANPWEILQEGIVKGIKAVGDRFGKGEYFLLELQEGAELAEKLLPLVKPKLTTDQSKPKGTVVMATVKGDLHDIGKNLVIMQLSLNGYKVHDMGMDNPAMNIINKAKEVEADVIGLSALLLSTIPAQEEVIQNLKELGLREKYVVVVGGGATTQKWATQIGADGWGVDAVQAVAVIDRLMEKKGAGK
jgi:methylmalonyl-CoA mutase cobalamin-binding domain/chain